MLRQLRSVAAVPGVPAKVRRLGVTVVGLAWGLAALPRSARWRPLPPERDDATGRELRGLLASPPGGGGAEPRSEGSADRSPILPSDNPG